MIEWLQSLGGRHKLLVAFGFGVLAACSLAPVSLWLAWFVALPGFLILIVAGFRKRKRFDFALGWSFGFGYFLVALHWIGFAFLVEAKTYLWMMPFAVIGLAGAMAIYWGLAAVAAQILRRAGLPIALGFPITLAIAEFLRGHLLTGFPWAAPGIAVDGMGGVLQIASLVGMPGLTLILLMWAATPFMFLRSPVIALGIILSLPLAYGWGGWRLSNTPQNYVEGVGLRIVQPNIAQGDKWRDENARIIFDQMLRATAAPDPAEFAITHVIWPEAAVSFLIDESDVAREEILVALQGNKVLLTGSLRRDKATEAAEEDRVFTSLIGFDANAEVFMRYDKWRLVPGGEYLPFEGLLNQMGFRKLVEVPGSFSAGAGPETFVIPSAGKAGPLICYEAIFSHDLIDPNNRPDWLINITNDGWFGQSAGPYQHFVSVRVRAVEQGLPIVRAANTGISGVVDGLGQIIEVSALGQEAIVQARLPAPLPAPLYGRYGDWILTTLVGVLTFFGIFFRRQLAN